MIGFWEGNYHLGSLYLVKSFYVIDVWDEPMLPFKEFPDAFLCNSSLRPHFSYFNYLWKARVLHGELTLDVCLSFCANFESCMSSSL